MPDLKAAFRYELLRDQALGLDPVKIQQDRFNLIWDHMPHLVPALSNRVRADINEAIARIVTDAMS